MSVTNICPCGSELDLEKCCLPLIQGKVKAATAQDLLRARYTAFTRGDVDFILRITVGHVTKSIEKRLRIGRKARDGLGSKLFNLKWAKRNNDTGTIVFGAHYRDRKDGKDHEHWEKSFFEKENGQWRFADAQGIQMGPYKRAEPKIGRNDPCTCGSGKKYKKCCG